MWGIKLCTQGNEISSPLVVLFLKAAAAAAAAGAACRPEKTRVWRNTRRGRDRGFAFCVRVYRVPGVDTRYGQRRRSIIHAVFNSRSLRGRDPKECFFFLFFAGSHDGKHETAEVRIVPANIPDIFAEFSVEKKTEINGK